MKKEEIRQAVETSMNKVFGGKMRAKLKTTHQIL